MRVLVTGGTGYIGSHICNRLAELGFRVTALDNLSNSRRDSINPAIHFLFADITDSAGLTQALEEHLFDCVIHCAALVDVHTSEQQPELTQLINVVGTAHMADYCAQKKIQHFIFSSSAAVYGLTHEPTVRESHPCLPINCYGKSKLAAENLLRLRAGANFKPHILRYFNVVGGERPQSFENSTALLPSLYRALQSAEQTFTVYGQQHPTPDGTCVRDFIHINDLVELHVALLRQLPQLNQPLILNCGTGHGLSVLQVFDYVNSHHNNILKAVFAAARSQDPHSVIANILAAQSTLNWHPESVGFRIFSVPGTQNLL